MFILYFKYSGLALRWLLGMVCNTLHIKPVLPKISGLVGELLDGIQDKPVLPRISGLVGELLIRCLSFTLRKARPTEAAISPLKKVF